MTVFVSAEDVLAYEQIETNAHVARFAWKARADRDGVGAAAVRQRAACPPVIGRGPEHARDVDTFAALFKDRPHRVPQVVIHSGSVGEVQLLPVSVGALEFSQTGNDLGFQIERSVSSRADETRRGRDNSFDRL